MEDYIGRMIVCKFKLRKVTDYGVIIRKKPLLLSGPIHLLKVGGLYYDINKLNFYQKGDLAELVSVAKLTNSEVISNPFELLKKYKRYTKHKR